MTDLRSMMVYEIFQQEAPRAGPSPVLAHRHSHEGDTMQTLFIGLAVLGLAIAPFLVRGILANAEAIALHEERRRQQERRRQELADFVQRNMPSRIV